MTALVCRVKEKLMFKNFQQKGINMNRVSLQKTRGAPLRVGMGLLVASLLLGTGVALVSAEGASNNKALGTTTVGGDDLSTDSLNKQINDLDAQIQKLRDQSLELQEKTRAKLQAQLENLKKQQDTLIPRIEKLRDNSETAWQDIKENIQKAIEDLKLSVDSMKK
jgi:septal ring factor EnvC (AmiA/AmiB activator)